MAVRKVKVENDFVAPVVVQKSFVEKMAPVLLLLVVGMSFALGSLWNKVKTLESTKSAQPTTANVGAAQQQNPTVDIKTIKGLFGKDLVKFGDANKKLLLVEVGDPSCPYCHVAGGKNPELNAQIGPQFKMVAEGGTYLAPVSEMRKLIDSGKASFVYLYTNGHGNGELAQKALYCAFEKGKFWQAHDKLMTNAGYNLINNEVKNDKANVGKLVDFLAGAVDSSFLKSCLESGKYDGRLASDSQIAAELGVRGTPGFFVNSTNFAGAYSWNDMKSVADAALK